MSDATESLVAARLQRLHAEVASPATLLPQVGRGHGLSADPSPATAADWLVQLAAHALDAEPLSLPTALEGAVGAALGLVRLQLAGTPGQAIEVTSRDGTPLDVDAAPGAALPVDGRGACWLLQLGPDPCVVVHADGVGVQLHQEPARGLWLAPLRLRTRTGAPPPLAQTAAAVRGAFSEDCDDVCAEALALWSAGTAAGADWADPLRLIVADRWREPLAAADTLAMLIAGVEPPLAPVDQRLLELGAGGRAELRRGALQMAAGLTSLPANHTALAAVRAALEAVRVALARHDGLSSLDLQLAALDRALLQAVPSSSHEPPWLRIERGLAPTAWWVGAAR